MNYWSSKPWIRIGTVSSLTCWIRIKWIRIWNTAHSRELVCADLKTHWKRNRAFRNRTDVNVKRKPIKSHFSTQKCINISSCSKLLKKHPVFQRKRKDFQKGYWFDSWLGTWKISSPRFSNENKGYQLGPPYNGPSILAATQRKGLCFELLNVLFWELKASPVAWAFFIEA